MKEAPETDPARQAAEAAIGGCRLSPEQMNEDDANIAVGQAARDLSAMIESVRHNGITVTILGLSVSVKIAGYEKGPTK